jgi:hypothetical protein
VETSNKTLEELAEVFNAKNPVKKSLEKTTVQITASGEVLNINEPSTT